MKITPEVMTQLGYKWVESRKDLIELAEPHWPYSQFEEDSYPCWVKPVDTFFNEYSNQELVIFDQISVKVVEG